MPGLGKEVEVIKRWYEGWRGGVMSGEEMEMD